MLDLATLAALYEKNIPTRPRCPSPIFRSARIASIFRSSPT